MIKPLEYYFVKKGIIEHVIFNKYTIDEYGIVRNNKTGKLIVRKKRNYNIITVRNDSDKPRSIRVARAIASTFLGPPPSPTHTADHKNKISLDDTLVNIRWLCKSGQRDNQDRPETLKTAFIIVKDEEEKTANEWVEHLKDQMNRLGRKYNREMINHYAQKKQYGFSYKEYSDLPGEVWKEVVGSKNDKGYRWEISDMNRVKYVTKHAENVLSGESLGLNKGYPRIRFNGKDWDCHIISFMTFFPEEYASKKQNELILHEDDDKLDFRPYKLRLGTHSDNMKDAHDNGRYGGTKAAKMRCVSYSNGVFEKEHRSQEDAVRYLKSLGFEKACESNISMTLSGDRKTAYGRTWEKYDKGGNLSLSIRR